MSDRFTDWTLNFILWISCMEIAQKSYRESSQIYRRFWLIWIHGFLTFSQIGKVAYWNSFLDFSSDNLSLRMSKMIFCQRWSLAISIQKYEMILLQFYKRVQFLTQISIPSHVTFFWFWFVIQDRFIPWSLGCFKDIGWHLWRWTHQSSNLFQNKWRSEE